MILLRRHGLLFIKTKKVAGTSVEIWLSRFVGPGDIATPISERDERRRAGTQAPQCPSKPIWSWRRRDLALLRHRRRWPSVLENHSGAREVMEVLGEEVFSAAHCFTIDRNPWDRLVSLYYYRAQPGDRASQADFSAFVRGLGRRDLSNSHLYMDKGGELLVDEVIRYEDLLPGLESVADRFDLGPVDLPRAKSGFRTRPLPTAELYSPAVTDFVAEVCRREVDLLGYGPPAAS